MYTCNSDDICEGIFAFYKRGFFSGGGGAPQLITELNLITSAILNRGTVSPDFTRATAASLLDFEDLIKNAISGEIRFSGALRIINLLNYSDDLSNAAWLKAGTASVTGTNILNLPAENDAVNQLLLAGESPDYRTFVASIYLSGVAGETVSLRIRNNPGDGTSELVDQQILLSAERRRYAVSITFDTALDHTNGLRFYIVRKSGETATQITVHDGQVDDVTGQINKNPNSYSSNNILSAPYHGAGIDCVKYLNYENGNTVDGSGVVTEANGDPISENLLLGYLCEIGRTNLALYSLDFGNAAWVTSNLTVTVNQLVGKKGLTDADTLTANAANATILQTISSASANRVFTLWLKRKTGTGNIDLTIDGGTTWQNITDDISNFVRIEIKQSAVTNPVFGVRIATSGDEVYAWGANLENGDFSTSFNETVATAISRNPDQLSYPNYSYKFLPNEFTFAVTVRPLTNGANYTNNEVRLFGTNDSGGVNDEVRTIGGGAYSYTHATGGGYFTINKGDLVGDQNTRFLFSLSQEGSDIRAIIYKDGVEKLNTTTAGTLNHSDTSVGIGHYAGDYFSGNFKNIKIWSGKLADAKLISESTL